MAKQYFVFSLLLKEKRTSKKLYVRVRERLLACFKFDLFKGMSESNSSDSREKVSFWDPW